MKGNKGGKHDSFVSTAGKLRKNRAAVSVETLNRSGFQGGLISLFILVRVSPVSIYDVFAMTDAGF